ncbi:hypothetical protein B0T17DRAFT_370798 [Bombardia bombarda]|uniref:Nicotinamide-nucleotide adenylyltransferase n=1 Tax=Bombardia bombarda TaxID=252184 RepID=A0AA39WGD0_9PEZI|nr:hypothetical protein B0T17DRAFT_370798 [Bombardia bombarda]
MPLANPESPVPATMERSLRAQPRQILDFFSHALASFQSSASKFQVVCTIPPTSSLHATTSGHVADDLPKPLPPRTRPRTLIILDSSFNPPTIAHLRMATSAIRAQKKLDPSTLRLLLLLAVNNADKAPKPAAFGQRLAMMWAFAQDIRKQQEEGQGLSIDVALSTQPYFHAKSAAIAEADFYNGHGDGNNNGGADENTEQVILAGYDTLIRILNPKYYGWPADIETETETKPIQKALDPFFARAKLRVTMRTDDEWGSRDEQLAYLQDLLDSEGLSKIGGSKNWGGRIEMVEGRKDGEDVVSSTYARDAARERDWDRLAKMVTPEVWRWVEGEGLYSD